MGTNRVKAFPRPPVPGSSSRAASCSSRKSAKEAHAMVLPDPRHAIVHLDSEFEVDLGKERSWLKPIVERSGQWPEGWSL